jgi:hypothetical protein
VYGQYAEPITQEQYATLEQQKIVAQAEQEQEKNVAANAFIEEIRNNMYYRNYPPDVGYKPVGRQLEAFLTEPSWSMEQDSEGHPIAVCKGIMLIRSRRTRLSVKFKRIGNQIVINEMLDNQDIIYNYAYDSEIVGAGRAELNRNLSSIFGAAAAAAGKPVPTSYQNKLTLAEFLEVIYRN